MNLFSTDCALLKCSPGTSAPCLFLPPLRDTRAMSSNSSPAKCSQIELSQFQSHRVLEQIRGQQPNREMFVMGKENLDMGWIKDSWSGELACLHLSCKLSPVALLQGRCCVCLAGVIIFSVSWFSEQSGCWKTNYLLKLCAMEGNSFFILFSFPQLDP